MPPLLYLLCTRNLLQLGGELARALTITISACKLFVSEKSHPGFFNLQIIEYFVVVVCLHEISHFIWRASHILSYSSCFSTKQKIVSAIKRKQTKKKLSNWNFPQRRKRTRTHKHFSMCTYCWNDDVWWLLFFLHNFPISLLRSMQDLLFAMQ